MGNVCWKSEDQNANINVGNKGQVQEISTVHMNATGSWSRNIEHYSLAKKFLYILPMS